MESNHIYPVRELDKGMGMAVAKRTYLREGECWADVAIRVAEGNCSLLPTSSDEQLALTKAIANASFLPAGRHLQHGDKTQKDRNIEVFSNCSTSCSSFIKFYLLLNGSGVGRMYDDSLMLVDWHNLPRMSFLLDPGHKDFREFIRLLYGLAIRNVLIGTQRLEAHPTFDDYQFRLGLDLYLEDVKNIALYNDQTIIYDMEDSREGWAKGLETTEVMAFNKKRDNDLVIDFSLVRESGKPIGGMQNRPASGPAYTAYAFWKIARLKYDLFSYYDFSLQREVERHLDKPNSWLQTMLVDHYASECVANGGARRSARIAVKYWMDEDIIDFVNLKHTFLNSDNESILWSSNNSVGVDRAFWIDAKNPGTHAYKTFKAITSAAYDTGEPGLINLDKLTSNEKGIDG